MKGCILNEVSNFTHRNTERLIIYPSPIDGELVQIPIVKRKHVTDRYEAQIDKRVLALYLVRYYEYEDVTNCSEYNEKQCVDACNFIQNFRHLKVFVLIQVELIDIEAGYKELRNKERQIILLRLIEIPIETQKYDDKK